MKKFFLFSLLVLLGVKIEAQVINQSANWPNATWILSGTYTSSALLNNPTTTNHFSFDDDAAGSSSLSDIVFAESPIIDLTPASYVGENEINITGDFSFMTIFDDDSLTIDYWDADAQGWVTFHRFSLNVFMSLDYQGCYNFDFSTSTLNISGFTPNQLTGFKYRISYTDGGGQQFGFCIGSPTITSSSCVEVAPYKEGFENNIACFLMEGNPDYNWTLHSGATPTSNTGPAGASIPGSGSDINYIYADASPPALTGDTTRFQTPDIDISGLANPRLRFEYHMYGAHIDKLIIQVDEGNGFVGIDTIVGQQHMTTDELWHTKTIDLSGFSDTIKVGFLAYRGTGFSGDIAIDDISIENEVGIAENNIEENVDLYPNPTNGIFNLKIEDIDTEGKAIQVIDSKGQVIRLINQEGDKRINEQIDLRGYAKGLYFVKINSRERTITKKVVIQ